MTKTNQLPLKTKITFPTVTLRDYQQPMYQAVVNEGVKRAVLVSPRRSGKDVLALQILASLAIKKKGNYIYCNPYFTQILNTVWKGKTHDGESMLDLAFPKEIVQDKNNSELRLTLINGSSVRFVGAESVDKLVGIAVHGVVFSEHALGTDRGWQLLRPAVKAAHGTAVFISTPRSKNHFYDLYEMAKSSPDWFCQHLTCEDTLTTTPEEIQEERDQGMPENLVQQEYFCSFDVGLVGTYFSDRISNMKDQNLITDVPYDPGLPVHTAWDLGISDATAIVFFQRSGETIKVIDCEETTGVSLQQNVKMIKEKGYVYGSHYFPHDINHRELTTGDTRLDMLRQLGIEGTVVPMKSINYGIECVHRLLMRTMIDKVKCAGLVNSLMSYRKQYDEKTGVYGDKPLHGPESHMVDSIRYLAIIERERVNEDLARQVAQRHHINSQLRELRGVNGGSYNPMPW